MDPAKPSSLVDTRVIYCGDNLGQVGAGLVPALLGAPTRDAPTRVLLMPAPPRRSPVFWPS